MIVLGIETATSVCGVGLSGDEGLIGDYKMLRGHIHGEHLPEAIENLFKDAAIPINIIDGIAVSIGPGSFTGLRIGLGVAKGLALGLGKPLIAVPTMDGLVFSIPGMCEWACILLHARKREVYQGLYCWAKGDWIQKGDCQVVPEEEIGRDLPKNNILFLGEGSLCYRRNIEKQIRAAQFLAPIYSQPSGYNIAEKGRQCLSRGEMADTDKLVPIYVKRFQGVA